MRIKNIFAENIPPIKNFKIEDLGSVVIIAGANGAGKSNLKQAIINTISNPQSPLINIDLESTRMTGEADRWGSNEIQLVRGHQNTAFITYMNSRTRGGKYTGNVIQVDSQRNITPVTYQPITLSTPDPDDIEIDTRYFLNAFSSRWQDVVNKIFQKSANRDSKIIKYVKDNPAVSTTGEQLLLRYPDPFKQYQDLFAKLLPGKTLDPIDPKNPHDFTYMIDGVSLPFSSLSSGEQEVVKITFDLLSKKMTHCIFLIDEPELHLHPTLTFRLIETLKDMAGGTNQFFFFTHSGDLISTYYVTGNVYFIDTVKNGTNEAKKLSELESTHRVLAQIMGENLGLFSVGKKIIFVEGDTSSIDRLTYHAIAQKYFPEAYVTPIGSVENMPALSRLSGEIEHRVFGIDFFMIRDKDGLNDVNIQEIETNNKMRCLKKLCLENYFLDADVLAKVAERFCIQDGNLKNTTYINTRLKEIASRFLNFNIQLMVKEYLKSHSEIEKPSVAAVETKTVAVIQTEYSAALAASLQEQARLLSATTIAQKFTDATASLTQALTNQDWLNEFSGKEIFSVYCGTHLRIAPEQVRQAYIEIAIKEKPEVFQDIIDIFEHFKTQ